MLCILPSVLFFRSHWQGAAHTTRYISFFRHLLSSFACCFLPHHYHGMLFCASSALLLPFFCLRSCAGDLWWVWDFFHKEARTTTNNHSPLPLLASLLLSRHSTLSPLTATVLIFCHSCNLLTMFVVYLCRTQAEGRRPLRLADGHRHDGGGSAHGGQGAGLQRRAVARAP